MFTIPHAAGRRDLHAVAHQHEGTDHGHHEGCGQGRVDQKDDAGQRRKNRSQYPGSASVFAMTRSGIADDADHATEQEEDASDLGECRDRCEGGDDQKDAAQEQQHAFKNREIPGGLEHIGGAYVGHVVSRGRVRIGKVLECYRNPGIRSAVLR